MDRVAFRSPAHLAAAGDDRRDRERSAAETLGQRQEGELLLEAERHQEAEALQEGDRLGPVGGRIVGEVLIGIIDADPESFRSVDPSWRPSLPSYEAGVFGIADILAPAA